MENNGTVQKIVAALSGLAIFFVFSAYVFLNARLKDTYGDFVFLVLLFLAIPRLAMLRMPGYRAALAALFWSYLALTLASVLFPPSTNANVSWLVTAQYRIIFSALIVLSLLNLSEIDRVVLRWGTAALCLLLSILYILQHNGFAVQESLAFLSPLKTDLSDWHDKNFAIWQLLLMWGSIGFLWGGNTAGRIATVPVAAFSLAAIFLSSSESSQLAAVISIAAFAAAHFTWLRRRYLLYCTAALSTVWIPVLWLFLTPVKPFVEQYLPRIHAVTIRLELFDYTAMLIRKELVLGYGFSSTLYRTIPKGEVGWWPFFPGGHTHNFPFQLLIDHGLLGLIFIAATLFLLVHYIYRATVETGYAPAVWALLTAGLVLFSFSYASWNADIVLVYCLWLGLIFANSSRHDLRVAQWLENPWLVRAIMLFGVTAVVCYGVDYLFLAGR
jgi:hypothetical protein